MGSESAAGFPWLSQGEMMKTLSLGLGVFLLMATAVDSGNVLQASDVPDHTQWINVGGRQPHVVVVDLYENEFVVTVDGIPTTYVFEVNPFAIEFAIGITGGNMPLDVTFQGYSTLVDCLEFRGGAGNDVVDNTTSIGLIAYGGSGDDDLDGGSGPDYLSGDDGNDVIRGRAGADYLDGGAGNDELRGQAGSDYIAGGEGADVLIGGDGADVLIPCTLKFTDGDLDEMTGNAGSDTFFASAFVYFPVWVPGLNKVVWVQHTVETDTVTDFQAIDVMGAYEVSL